MAHEHLANYLTFTLQSFKNPNYLAIEQFCVKTLWHYPFYMSIELLQSSLATAQSVLKNVEQDQLALSTPCTDWNVRELINHFLGVQWYFHANAMSTPLDLTKLLPADCTIDDCIAALSDVSQANINAYSAEGIMEKLMPYALGELPGRDCARVAAHDLFIHTWDLAKATGQDTNLNPQLATTLFASIREGFPDSIRGDEGKWYKFEQTVGNESSVADEYAAFCGRQI